MTQTTSTATQIPAVSFEVSQFLARDIETIAHAASHADYLMDAEGVRIVRKSLAQAFRRQMRPAKGADFDTIAQWIATKPRR